MNNSVKNLKVMQTVLKTRKKTIMAERKKSFPGGAGPGRPKGLKNKFTTDLKAAYLEAFEKRGGVQGLLDWAETSPDVFYSQVSKMLPKEVAATLDDKREMPDVTLVVGGKCRKI